MLQKIEFSLPSSTDPLRVKSRGLTILNDPWLNKGTSFTAEERIALGLSGLLPPHSADIEEQVMRVMENYEHLSDPLDKYTFLIGLADRNITLFFRVLMENLQEMTPIMYTPTVGYACQKFGHIYRKNRGMYISLRHKGRIAQVLANWPSPEVDIIVISDGSRILGLGDLGANGMGIPIGKLVLYVVGAGLHPNRTLPILLDVGTDNDELLNDPLYLGCTHRRVHGEEFYEIVDEFVQAATKRWPNVLIQWEDFTNDKAFPLLNRYRDEVLCFNDDIQGTGAVALAGLYSALRITGGQLSEQRVLFLGAGEAAVGIAGLIVAAMVGEGLSEEEARSRCWLVDSGGLVVKSRPGLANHKLPYAHDHAPLPDLLTAIEAMQPTTIIGVSGQPSTFTEPVLAAMARLNDRPIVFALSNPTSKAECTAEQAYVWTGERAIFASGSPFPPVSLGTKTYTPGQGNNAYIFPGVGLGAIACGAKLVTDEMFFAAAKALARQVSESDLERGLIYPPLTAIREVSAAIATAVVEVAYKRGLATQPKPDDIQAAIEAQMYVPRYRTYV